MQLALTLGVSQTNYAAVNGKLPNSNVLVGVGAQGQAGTITVTSGASGSGSPMGLLLTITKP